MNATSDIRSLEGAFGALGDETRLAVLAELDAADGPLSFAELRRRVGAGDSGGFNYHLSKLTDGFVRKGEDGYELRHAGAAVVGAVRSGVYDRGAFDEPVPVGDDCSECGGSLVMTYAEERARIGCEDCGEPVAAASVPPGVFDGYDPADLPTVFDRWVWTKLETVRAGFCVRCQGRTRGRVEVEPVETRDETLDGGPTAVYECERCGDRIIASVASAVAGDPDVIAFHRDHGIDLRETPSWQADWLQDAVSVDTESPLRVRVSVELDDEVLSVLVDDSLSVLETERRVTA